jgi:L-ascorbate metabolism protein UlaG (beta-lactamase superfamily)
MKITRYFQSCLLIEEQGVRLLIDPSGQEKGRLSEFGEIDAVFYTHEHGDHFDAEMARTFVEEGVAPVYANASTAGQIKASVTTLEDNQEYDVNGLKVKALELPHCLMWDGKQLAGLEVAAAALPISGPDISLKDAFDFAKQLKLIDFIPVHYDYLGGNPEVVVDVAKGMGLTGHALDIGQSVELN